MKDAPLARMGEMWAKLYYHMAKEMLSLEEEGEKALRRSIRNYAEDRGKATKAIAESLGLPLTYETFGVTVKDMPFKEMCEEMVKYYPDVKSCKASEGFCAYAEFWRNYKDGFDVSKIYCDEFHHSKWAAFNPKFKVDMVATITKGDPNCQLVSYIEGDDYDKKRKKTIEEICTKAKSYGFLVDKSEHGKLENACKKK